MTIEKYFGRTVIPATRQEETNHEECNEYEQEQHAPLVEERPGLRTYTTSVPADPDDFEVDYVTQLWFDRAADAKAAFESDVGERVRRVAAGFLVTDELRTVSVGDVTTHVER